MKWLGVIVICLIAASSLADEAVTLITVDNNMEKHDKFGGPGKLITVAGDSGLYVLTKGDVGNACNMNFANGIGGGFSRNSNFCTQDDANFTWELATFGTDTCYFTQGSFATAIYPEVYKFTGTTLHQEDSLSTTLNVSFGIAAINLGASSAVGHAKIASDYQGVFTLASGVIGDATDWALVDSFLIVTATTQARLASCPAGGGLVVYQHDVNEFHLIESDGTLHADIASGIADVHGMDAYDGVDNIPNFSMTPFDEDGTSDSLVIMYTDSLTMRVWARLGVVNMSAGTISLGTAYALSAFGSRTYRDTDFGGWRYAQAAMVGDGIEAYFRSWNDTTNTSLLTTDVVIKRAEATDRSDFSTFATATDYYTRDSILEVHTPWRFPIYDGSADSSVSALVFQFHDNQSTSFLVVDTLENPSAAAAGGDISYIRRIKEGEGK